MEIIQAYLTKNPCYKKATPALPVGILVHATGANNRTLKRYVDSPERLGKNTNGNTWNRSDASTCVHAFIGYDKDNKVIVAETLPHKYACWGCGKGNNGSYNYDPTAHIQFEICQGSDTDADYYWKAIGVAEEYCAHLCKKYGWSAKKITSHVEAHKAGYASNHGDPTSWMKHFGDSMDKFRERVAARLGEKEESVVGYKATVKTKSGGGASIWTDNKKTKRVVLVPDGETLTVTGGYDTKGFAPVEYKGYKGVFDAQYLVRVSTEVKDESLHDKLVSIRAMLDEVIAKL